jgi:acetyltransferase-like isoleucine patch superfamily enzyme
MKRFAIWIIIVVFFGLTGLSSATPILPFIRVSTSTNEVDLGMAHFFKGIHEVTNALKVEVETNCWHGPVVISTTPLEHQGGGIIEPDDIYVRTPKIGHYVSLKHPVIILPTGSGTQNVMVDFQVQADLNRPSGQYKGMLTLTIIPPV